jgi:hypothetical protein
MSFGKYLGLLGGPLGGLATGAIGKHGIDPKWLGLLGGLGGGMATGALHPDDLQKFLGMGGGMMGGGILGGPRGGMFGAGMPMSMFGGGQ